MPATKLDLKSEFKELYSAKRTPALVDVPELQFLMIDGVGDPNTSAEYADAISALYSIAYTIKFAFKKSADAIDFPVMPLQGLWWARDMTAFKRADKGSWQWTMMIMQPDIVGHEHFVQAVRDATAKKQLPSAGRLRMERFAEGRAAQVMHVGPYSAEEPTIRALHEFIAEQGLELSGKHHEIYLGDPRRSAPEKLRTVIRQPVAG